MDAQYFNFQGTKRFVVIIAADQGSPLGYQALTINNQADAASLVAEISLNLKQDPSALQYAFNDLLNKPIINRINARNLAPKLTDAISKKRLKVYFKSNSKKQSGTTTATLAPQSAASSQNSQSVSPSNQGRQTQAVVHQGGSENTTATEVATKDQTVRSDPVSMLSGEEILPLVDFELSGLMQLTWLRLYRSSKSQQHTSLGYGWRHCFALCLAEKYTPPPKVGPKISGTYFFELTDEEGRVHIFDKVKLGQTSYQSSSGWALQYQSLDQQVLVKPDDSHWTFRKINGHWLLESIIDFKGCYIGLYYDEQHRLARITCSPTRGVLLQYKGDKLNNIKSYVLNKQGKRDINPNALVKYDYNEYDQLISCIDNNQNKEHYQYSNKHLLIKRTRPSGFSHHFKWQGDNETAKCIAQWGDNDIYNYRFEYHETHTFCIDSRGGKESFYHNEAGLLSKYIDALGNQSQYFYNNSGQKIKEMTANGAEQNFEYNHNGQLISQIDAMGAKTQFGYNQFGQRILTINALGQHFSKRFDATGHLLEQGYPDGRKHSYQYNATGLIIEEVDVSGIISLYHRGSNGEILAKQVGEVLTRFSYDLHGRLSGTLSSEGLLTQFNRNNKGLITCQSEEFLNNQELKRNTHYHYDNAGRLISIEDPNGELTQYEFDGLAQPAAKILPDGSWLAYHYDQERNLTGIERSDGNKYEIEYDANENPKKIIGFDGREQVFSFDNNNKLSTATDNAQRHMKLTRDLNGRVISQQHSVINAHEIYSHQNQFKYDKLGRLTKAFNGERTINFGYHQNGELAHSEQGFWQLDYCYNKQGKRSQLNLPDGNNILYLYDIYGRLTHIKIVEQTTNQSKLLVSYQYDKSDHLISAKLGNGIQLTQEFDGFNRLTQQNWVKDNVFSRQRDYHYDHLNRVIKLALSQKQDAHQNQNFNYNNVHQLVSHNTTNIESNSNSIKSNTDNTEHNLKTTLSRKQYHWDAFGNPVNTNLTSTIQQALRPKSEKLDGHINDGTSELSCEVNSEVNQDRLKQYQGVDYFYDGSGNQTRAWGLNLDQNRAFDGLNQLRQITHNNQLTKYEYDALGRRSAKITEAGRTDFIWDSNQLIGEYTNGEFSWYVYIPDTFEPVALIKNGQIFYYHLDQLSTPQYLTNEQAQLVWQNNSDAFGKANEEHSKKNSKENNKINSQSQPIRFQGQYFDDESGLHYNRYRYYCPQQQRFIHQDPIGLIGGINHYQYAPNPVNWVDPLGLSCKETSDEAHEAWLKKMTAEQGIKPVAVLPVEWLVEGIADAANAIGNMFDTGITAQGVALTAVALIPGKTADKALEPVIKKLDTITLDPGKKGSWNKKLNKDLNPNSNYKVGNYTYKTDELGRVKGVSGKLDLSKVDRNTYQQGKAGKLDGIKDGLTDDEGGHLIASIFKGPGEQINYAAMDGNLNKGAWKRMENNWAKALKGDPPKKVEVNIRAFYDGENKRPSKFIVDYMIDDEPFKSTFKNKSGQI